MSRYIDADALITDLNKGLWGKDWDKVLAEAIINEAPSIDICFCRECKWCDDAGKKRALICTNPYIDVDPHPNFFCGYGEREGE